VNKFLILPCSGIGKSLGSVAREAAYIVKERTDAIIKCLPRITVGEKEALDLLNKSKIITIDGCPEECALKNVQFSNVEVFRAFRVGKFIRGKKLKPDGILELNEDGKKLAELLAEKIIGEMYE